MENPPQIHHHTDEPTQEAKQDLFGFIPLASKTANFIKNIVTNDLNTSYSIGLLGEWGSGKTSLANLIKEQLTAEIEQQSIIWVEFKPWLFSGHQNLIEQFFSTLEETCEKHQLSDVNKSLEAFQKALFAKQADLPYLLITIVSIITAGFLPKIFVSEAFHYIQWWEWVILIPMWVGIIFYGFQLYKNSKKVSNLDGQKGDIAKALSKSGKKIIVFIDDIDRLLKDEVLDVFRLIRSTADFKNIVYIVSYAPTIVNHLLTQELGEEGNTYCEKIIQLPLNVPLPSKRRFLDSLCKGLDDCIPVDQQNDPQERRSYYLEQFQQLEMRSFFNSLPWTPRKLKRLLNNFKFHFSGMENDLFWPDLLFIEALNVFYPKLYQSVEQHVNLLARNRTDIYFPELEEDHNNKQFDQLLVKHEAFKPLFKTIFPRLPEMLEHKNHHRDADLTNFAAYKRIGHPDYFERYFLSGLHQRDITAEEINALVNASEETFEEVFKHIETRLNNDTQYILKSLHEQLLQVLEPTTKKILFKNLLALPSYNSKDCYVYSVFSKSTDGTLQDVMIGILRSLNNTDKLNTALAEFCLDTLDEIDFSDGISRVIELIRRLIADYVNEYPPIFSDSQKIELKDKALLLIEQRLKQKQLLFEPALANVLYRWRDWESQPETIKPIIDSLVHEESQLIAFIEGMTGRVSGDRGDFYYLRYNIADTFITPENHLAAIKKLLQEEKLTKEAEEAIQVLMDDIDKPDQRNIETIYLKLNKK